MPRPPCSAEHGPSEAPAITGPPPQDDEAGPLHAHVASDQQCAKLVSISPMPASSAPFVMPTAAALSRMISARALRSDAVKYTGPGSTIGRMPGTPEADSARAEGADPSIASTAKTEMRLIARVRVHLACRATPA